MMNSLSKKIKNKNIRVHSIEAKSYDKLHREIFNTYEQKKILNELKIIYTYFKKGSVLDVGCGTGNLTIQFIQKGYYVDGLDISKDMINELKQKIKSKKIHLYNQDIDEFLKITNKKYDIISFSSVLHHLPNYQKTLKNCIKKLTSNGILYVIHEPLNNNETILDNIIEKIDYYLYRFNLYLKQIKTQKIDYSYADIHCKNGIDAKKLIDTLNINKNFEILLYEEYNARKFMFFSKLQNLIGTKKNFRFLIRKI
ncbi:MAG: class I SAM-dependent methyltransferase [DPANN group archaeon]|nr:class I SAM-dependent methyltransferase [DPANN group archaeon]